ncbi:helix-turn-helix transcriptional regulator [Streptomyces sp. NBC_01317]|uniref:helix-turn-helix domain-containing protein n=1 Tax=Streptomyces sp. NBC_01317 TaxID=2903822 RepID=UPI002E1064C6|nr:helix-turn-helix transcriptional regulator [Streptomyces sp. NBC_01317]
MSVEGSHSPVAWRYAGDQLKRWRTKAGISREELGTAANYAPDTIKAMEQGVRMPTPKLLDAADDLLRAEGLLSAAKQYLRRERFPARAQNFMVQEREAISLWSYEVALIPGLLQTEEYARALIGNFSLSLAEETVEERVAARLERQMILTRKPPVAFSFVLYEAALRGPQVSEGQLRHLLEAAALRNVSLQVLPYARAIPAALGGPMVLLENQDHDRFAFAEGPFASELTSEPEQVSLATERLSMIRMEALGTEDSARFLERMVDERCVSD